ncbi:MAG: SdrD B-like domain-containing protein [Anaerolineales bacterium]
MKSNRLSGTPALIFLLVLILGCNITTPVPTGGPGSIVPILDTPAIGPGAIYGVLWHDICKFTGGEAGEAVVLGQGCVQYGTGPADFGPNQVYDDFETGWAGVTLHIGSGACPAAGTATAVTDASGNYRFDGLAAGTYCVFYSPLTDGNDAILIPGGPTYPERGEAGALQTVVLGAGEEKEVNFGFAWQFFN